jgi:hypothetical protein
MAKKIKKAILAGLTAYAAAKMMKASKAKAALSGVPEGATLITKKPYKHELEKYISPKKPEHLGDTGKSMDYMTKKPWWKFWKEGGSISAPIWKKHGGSIRTEHARMGKMIKAAQGTYAREDESLGMRLGKGKGTAKERDMSYGKWGNRGKDWAKSGKMIKARHGTEVRTMGSNPFTPKGSVVGVQTKLNGTVKTRVY